MEKIRRYKYESWSDFSERQKQGFYFFFGFILGLLFQLLNS
jgi:hypothetical protein